MPSLKEIKTRIASVNSTRKITSAMKMVASSKLHHAQVAIQNMLPYGNMLEHILKSFLVSTPNVDHPLQLEHKETKRIALVVYSSNSSLCGGFNSNVIKMMMHAVDEYKATFATSPILIGVPFTVLTAIFATSSRLFTTPMPRMKYWLEFA